MAIIRVVFCYYSCKQLMILILKYDDDSDDNDEDDDGDGDDDYNDSDDDDDDDSYSGGDGDDNDHEGDDISDGDGDDDDDDDDDNDSDGDGDDDDDDQCGGRHSCYPVENRFEETPNILFTVIVYKMNLFSVRLSNNDFQGCFCFIFLHWLADNSFCFHIVCL